MKNRGERKVLQRKDGKYFIALDITVEEWREMLLNDEVFYPDAREMIVAWYLENGHMATSKAMTQNTRIPLIMDLLSVLERKL